MFSIFVEMKSSETEYSSYPMLRCNIIGRFHVECRLACKLDAINCNGRCRNGIEMIKAVCLKILQGLQKAKSGCSWGLWISSACSSSRATKPVEHS